MINYTHTTNCTGILSDNGKVLNKEQYIAVIIETIKKMCTHIGQTYLIDTKPEHLSEVSAPEINEEKEILINVRILITYYKIVAVIMHKDNRRMLQVKSFGAV